jgi:hypothetical protein
MVCVVLARCGRLWATGVKIKRHARCACPDYCRWIRCRIKAATALGYVRRFTIFSTAHWEQPSDAQQTARQIGSRNWGRWIRGWTYLSCPANVGPSSYFSRPRGLLSIQQRSNKSASPSPKRRKVHPCDPRQKISVTAKAGHWRHRQSRQKSLKRIGDSSV